MTAQQPSGRGAFTAVIALGTLASLALAAWLGFLLANPPAVPNAPEQVRLVELE